MSGERILKKDVVVDAPVAAVWAAWTTEEGVRGFFAPAAKVEATRGYGARVIAYDRYSEDREALGRALSEEQGATLVPLDIHFNARGLAKVQLGLAEGRNKADKRHAIAARDWQRDKARLMRERG